MPTLKEPRSRRPTPRATAPLRMTEAEFMEWDSDELRVEWVDGEVEFMNAVLLDHAKLTLFIIHRVGGFVDENKLGEVYAEPFQVRLPMQRRRRSPDVFFVSNQQLKLLEDRQFNGAPELIVEVVSADSQNRDTRVKFMETQ